MVIKRSNRGTPVDMDALISNSSKRSPAVGNMRVNANGDVIDSKGNIVQKSEDRARAYYKDNPKSSTASASLKDPIGNQRLPAVDSAPNESNVPSEQKKATKPTKTAPKVKEPDEFDPPNDAEPLGYNEVQLDNGDIEMVPYYKPEDKDE